MYASQPSLIITDNKHTAFSGMPCASFQAKTIKKKGNVMARIEIMDLQLNGEIPKEAMKKVRGGFLLCGMSQSYFTRLGIGGSVSLEVDVKKICDLSTGASKDTADADGDGKLGLKD